LSKGFGTKKRGGGGQKERAVHWRKNLQFLNEIGNRLVGPNGRRRTVNELRQEGVNRVGFLGKKGGRPKCAQRPIIGLWIVGGNFSETALQDRVGGLSLDGKKKEKKGFTTKRGTESYHPNPTTKSDHYYKTRPYSPFRKWGSSTVEKGNFDWPTGECIQVRPVGKRTGGPNGRDPKGGPWN